MNATTVDIVGCERHCLRHSPPIHPLAPVMRIFILVEERTLGES